MTSFYWNNTNFEWKKYQLWDGEKVTRLYNNNGNKHPFPKGAYTDDLLYVFCLLPLKVQESSNITNLVEKLISSSKVISWDEGMVLAEGFGRGFGHLTKSDNVQVVRNIIKMQVKDV